MNQLPPPEPIWPETSTLVNYEANTLPLLFAPDEDFNAYYRTMKQLHERKSRQLTVVQKIGARAKALKEKSNYLECVRTLDEAARERHNIFRDDDYQVLAAHEHLVWSAIHLAVISMADENESEAHKLLQFAAECMREYAHSEGNAMVKFVPFDRHKLLFSLHHTFANYWARRSKWNAAHQSSAQAEKHWASMLSVCSVDPSTPEIARVSDHISARRLIALSCISEGSTLKPVCVALEEIASSSENIPGNMSGDEETEEGDREEAPSSDPQRSVVTIKIHSEQPNSGNTDPAVLEAVFCASSPHEDANSPWSFYATTTFVAAYGAAFARYKQRRFEESKANLEHAALVATSQAEQQPSWWRKVEFMSHLLIEAPGRDLASGFGMKASASRSEEVLTMAQLLREHVRRQQAEKSRHQEERLARKRAEEFGGDDATDQSMSAQDSGPLPLRPEETSGLGVVAADLDGGVAAWMQSLPVLESTAKPKDALRKVCANDVVTPLEAARGALRVKKQLQLTHRSENMRASTPVNLPHLDSAPTSDHASRVATPAPLRPRSRQSSLGLTQRRALTPSDKVIATYHSKAPGKRVVQANTAVVPTATPTATTSTEVPTAPTSADEAELILDEAMEDLVELPPEHVTGTPVANLMRSMRAKEEAIKRLKRSLRRDRELVSTYAKLDDAATRGEAEYESHRSEVEAIHAEREKQQLSSFATSVSPKRTSPSKKGSKQRLQEAASLVGRTAVEERHLSAKRYSSGFKINVGTMDSSAVTDTNAHMGQFYGDSYSKTRLSATQSTDETGTVHATKVSDIVPAAPLLVEKQRILRSMLPTLDHRTAAYRMVTKELAENERILRTRRQERDRENLEKHAERIAKKAGIFNTWSNVIKKKQDQEAAAHATENGLHEDYLGMCLAGLVNLAFVETPSAAPQVMEPVALPQE